MRALERELPELEREGDVCIRGREVSALQREMS